MEDVNEFCHGGEVKRHKNCFVPQCGNSTRTDPDKIFVQLPMNESRRCEWLNAARQVIKPKSTAFFCEDHFDLEDDMENYLQYKYMGGKIILKKTALPKYFSCQGRQGKLSMRPAVEKLNRKRLIAEVEKEITGGANDYQDVCIEDNRMNEDHRMNEENRLNEDNRMNEVNCELIDLVKLDKKIQVTLKPHVRSKESQANPCHSNACVSPIKFSPVVMDVAISPIKFPRPEIYTSSSDSSELTSSQSSSSNPSSQCSDSTFLCESEVNDEFKQKCLDLSMTIIEKYPRLYIGLPEDNYFILDIITKVCDLNLRNIFLTLKKIRLNLSFAVLGNEFGVSSSQASRIFKSTVPILSAVFSDFIFRPSCNDILAALPISFRLNYSKTTDIIDCFEIEIEKPTNALHQALTWSEYKHCNTIKYLVSGTPNGLVNFVSTGFGGRASDITIVKESKFWDHIAPDNGISVMADRGFKGIEEDILDKGCTLIRPPTVESDRQPSKKEVLQTRQIASLRIHVERIIRRIREFKMVAPHSVVDNHLIGYMDHVVKIVCGLINLQEKIIR